MKNEKDTYRLLNGVEIPCIGFGTWQTPEGDVAVNSVKCAIQAGYRHIDTAQAYGNEESVSPALPVKNSLLRQSSGTTVIRMI